MTRLVWYFIVFLFILCGVFYVFNMGSLKEGMSQMEKNKRMCGNLLVKEGNKVMLYNSNVAKVPGVNPIVFNTLEEYGEFVMWQDSQGFKCPVMMLEESYDTQGNKTYIPSDGIGFMGAVSDDLIQNPYEGADEKILQPLIDASYDNPPYNIGNQPGFDPLNQQIGSYTTFEESDKARQQQDKSPLATDDNWGGPEYAQQQIDSGAFDGEKVFVKR